MTLQPSIQCHLRIRWRGRREGDAGEERSLTFLPGGREVQSTPSMKSCTASMASNLAETTARTSQTPASAFSAGTQADGTSSQPHIKRNTLLIHRASEKDWDGLVKDLRSRLPSTSSEYMYVARSRSVKREAAVTEPRLRRFIRQGRVLEDECIYPFREPGGNRRSVAMASSSSIAATRSFFGCSGVAVEC